MFDVDPVELHSRVANSTYTLVNCGARFSIKICFIRFLLPKLAFWILTYVKYERDWQGGVCGMSYIDDRVVV
jgi:hypothetical protein